jgi:TPR repeat protein
VDRQNSPKSVALARARKSRSALARQLWSALGAGDSSAEVPLAQLYLTGDGVPRSCDQARVLLSAASKKGNIEALRQLQQLKKNTCR